MRAVVRVFLTLMTKTIEESLIYKKTPSRKVFHMCTKKFFPKFEIIKVRNKGVMDY